jgi:hypothetical protein
MFYMVGTEDAFIRQSSTLLSTENDVSRNNTFKRWLDKGHTTTDSDEKTRSLFTA